jgi:hypothetical protein
MRSTQVFCQGGKWNSEREQEESGHFTGGKFEFGRGKIAVFSGPPENNTGSKKQSIPSHYSTSHLDDIP